MALFPRRVGGRYVMLSRRDRENLHLATSTDVLHWSDVTELHRIAVIEIPALLAALTRSAH